MPSKLREENDLHLGRLAELLLGAHLGASPRPDDRSGTRWGSPRAPAASAARIDDSTAKEGSDVSLSDSVCAPPQQAGLSGNSTFTRAGDRPAGRPCSAASEVDSWLPGPGPSRGMRGAGVYMQP